MKNTLKRYVKKQYDKLQRLYNSVTNESAEYQWLFDNKNRILNISASLAKKLYVKAIPKGYKEVRVLELAREISEQSHGNINEETLAIIEKFSLTDNEFEFLPDALKISLIDMVAQMLEEGKNIEFAPSTVKSLILFREIDFDALREKCLIQEKILLKDEVYQKSDKATRAIYRKKVAALAFESGKSEKEVLEIAFINGSITESLFSKDNFLFLNSLGVKEKEENSLCAYILKTIIPALIVSGLWWLIPAGIFEHILLSVFSFIPSAVFFNTVLNRNILSNNKPTKPMRLKAEEADIPENKTAVVLTVMLSNKDSVNKAVKTIEEYFSGNYLKCGRYFILADLKESDKEKEDDDASLTEFFEKSIAKLNEQYGFYFGGIIRNRQKNGNVYSGWERKRGAIEQLVRFIKNNEEIFGTTINGELLENTKYICTLDADTVIPPESIIKLLSVITHPVNKNKGLIQPNIGTMPERQTPFQKILAPIGGIDAYSTPLGEVYNDYFNSATFCGKGIFSVDAYMERVKIQPNTVLSHDIVEGEMMEALGANDVNFLDEFPADPIAYYKRKERWQRGDWILAPFVFSELKAISKWKILFNLFQSQFFTGIFLKAVIAPFFGMYAYLIWAVCLFELSMPSVFAYFDTLQFSMEKHAFFDNRENRKNSIKRSVLNKIFLPFECYLGVITMFKGLWRRLVSHKKILEWNTFASTKSLKGKKEYFLFFLPAILLAIVFYASCMYNGIGIVLGFIVFVLWCMMPYFAFELGQKENRKREELAMDEIHNLKLLSMRTLRFFYEALEDNNYLMPDNLQLKPYKGYAKRTSPTNLGFALLSVPCGLKAGAYSPSFCLINLEKQINEIKTLKTHKGHLYNWYDLNTKKPLGRYVSTVDSGNYCAALITIKGSFEQIRNKHVFLKSQCNGIGDMIYSYIDSLPEDFKNHLTEYADDFYSLSGKQALQRAKDFLDDGILSSIDGIEFIQNAVRYWIQDYNGLSFSDKIFQKIEKTKEFNLRPLKDFLKTFPKTIDETLAIVDFDCRIEEYVWSLGREKYSDLLKEIRNEFQRIYNYAYSVDCRLKNIEKYIDSFLKNIDFKCLYNEKKKLFSIGMDEEGRSNNCYDMLVSEARLTSFITIALGKIPAENWFSLMRPFTRISDTPLCLSWSGTMFEYLMPDIFIKPTENSMLSTSNRIAVKTQEEFLSKNGLWGVSESAFNAFDFSGEYKYKAFGVSKLALSAEKSEKVFSPYSTLLAIEYDPKGCMQNIVRFVENGCVGIYGMFEAYDAKRNGIVYSHMAHHSGMGLTALINYLYNGALRRMFLSNSYISAAKVLLEEKMPIGVLPRKEEAEKTETEFLEEIQFKREFISPDKQSVETLVLAYRDMRCEISSKGRILLFNGNVFIGEAYLYVKDNKTSSVSYLPVKDLSAEYKTEFYPEKALFKFSDNHTNVTLEIFVAGDSGEFLWRVKVKNKREETAKKEVMLFIKPALCEFKEYFAHPAFNGLFMEAEAGEELMFRNRKSKKVCYLSGVSENKAVFQSDAVKALGRGNDFSKPLAIFDKVKKYPVTPLMCCKIDLDLAEFEEKGADFILTSDSKSLMKNKAAINLATENAKIYSNGEISAFALNKEQWLFALKIASFKSAEYRMGDGAAFPDTLWQYGISDNVPLLTLLLPRDFQKEKLKFILKSADYLMSRGFFMQVLIIEDTVNDYLDGAFNYTDREIRALISKDKIYHIKKSNIRDEKLKEIIAMSFLKINVEGDVFEQIGKVDGFINIEKLKIADNKYPPSKNEDIIGEFDNGFGKFINDFKEYFIYKKTPMPWANVISNNSFGTLLTENGGGYLWQGNSALNKLSPWYNDSITNPLGEALYIRDNNIKRFWSITRDPVDSGDEHSTVFGKGYAVYNYGGFGMNQKQTVFVHKEKPIKVIKVDIENHRNNLSAFYFIKPLMGESFIDAFKFIEIEEKEGMLCAKRNNEYMFIYAKDAEYCDNARAFFGNGDLSKPYAVYSGDFIKCEKGKQLLALKINTKSKFNIFIGYAKSEEELKNIKVELDNADVEQWLEDVKNHWDERAEKIQIKTPDNKLDAIFNNWLYYQCVSSRLQAKCGFYQAGGAWGFRDQLQDCLMLMISEPAFAKAHILKCAAHQFKEGDVQHWWHDPYQGVRTHVSDDLLFLPYIASIYARTTGDEDIFNVEVPFLEGHTLSDRDDLYENAWQSEEKGTLYEHCIRAIKLAIQRTGERGLPLILGGDWNDGMNNLGKKGKGESVWLGWFLFSVISEFMPYAQNEKGFLKNHAKKLYDALNNQCWDGQWYLRAFDDENRKIGSKESLCAKIDAISQAWSVLSGAGKYAEKAMKSVEEHLIDSNSGIVKLLTPPFDEKFGAGYIGNYIPGVRENGGQYTHGALWVARAFFEMGKSEKGYEVLDMLNPINHSNNKSSAQRYMVEPYVIPADIYSNEENVGRGGWSWYTASASMYYVTVLSGLLGVNMEKGKINMTPHIPPSWREFFVKIDTPLYKYDIKVLNPSGKSEGSESITEVKKGDRTEIRVVM